MHCNMMRVIVMSLLVSKVRSLQQQVPVVVLGVSNLLAVLVAVVVAVAKVPLKEHVRSRLAQKARGNCTNAANPRAEGMP